MDRKTLAYQEALERQKANEEDQKKANAAKRLGDVRKHLEIQMKEKK